MCENKRLVCRQCGAEFDFTAEQQMFYAEKGFKNEPRRCPECRASARAMDGAARPKKEMFTVICEDCGMETEIPFKPKGDRPVYCRECFAKHR